jgi:hypothetical protein
MTGKREVGQGVVKLTINAHLGQLRRQRDRSEVTCTSSRLYVHVKCAPSTSDLAIYHELSWSGRF